MYHEFENPALAAILSELRAIRQELRDLGDFDAERTPPEDIVELCAALRALPRERQPLAFESGGPDGFGQIWKFNAREALVEEGV